VFTSAESAALRSLCSGSYTDRTDCEDMVYDALGSRYLYQEVWCSYDQIKSWISQQLWNQPEHQLTIAQECDNATVGG
jgi:hypothetical protein